MKKAPKQVISTVIGLRESFMIGLLRAFNFSAHRQRRKLKFSEVLLLALIKEYRGEYKGEESFSENLSFRRCLGVEN